MAHPDKDKFVPGSVWNDGYADFEVLEERAVGLDGKQRGYLVRLLEKNQVVGHSFGWKEPASEKWKLVKAAPVPVTIPVPTSAASATIVVVDDVYGGSVEVEESYDAWKERMVRESNASR